MIRPLMPHQRDAMSYAENRDHIALFMEMRLGKTLVAIRWAQPFLTSAASLGGALVVAPLTVLAGWANELKAEKETGVVWLTNCSPKERMQRALTCGRWFLINYEALRNWKEAPGIPWMVVICDESTRIRNPKAQITKVLTRKFFDVPHRAILSGLPNPESPTDYFEQMRFVSDNDRWMGFSNFWKFRESLFFEVGYDWIPRRGKNGKPGTIQRIKDAVHEDAFVLTRKQAGIGSIKVYETRVIPADTLQKLAMKDIRKKFSFEGVRTLETKSAGVQFLWEQRIAGGFSPDRENPAWLSDGKFQEIKTLLTGELKQEQVVIWFRFNQELAAVYHGLKTAGISTVAILGATPVLMRERRRLEFQRGKAQVCCIQVGVGRYGLDLSASDTAIYYSNTWEYEARAQSEDRIVHPKKTQPLLYVDLITDGSTDEDAVEALRDKSVTASTFTNKLLSLVRSRYAQGTKSRAA